MKKVKLIPFCFAVFLALIAYPCSAVSLPRPEHVVVVIEENHAFTQIIGNKRQAGFINRLAEKGALLTGYHAAGHPSQPNYLVLFSGSNQGVTSDEVPAPLSPYATPNLADALAAKGFSFRGYAQDLPYPGFQGSSAKTYARKHCPWTNWKDSKSLGYPFSDFPSDFSKLPTVSFVIPGLMADMHDGTIHQGDAWLKKNLKRYIAWARTHDSLLILTFDEDNRMHQNHIPTVLVGPMVKKGRYRERFDHYDLFQTLVEMYGLTGTMNAKTRPRPIPNIWK